MYLEQIKRSELQSRRILDIHFSYFALGPRGKAAFENDLPLSSQIILRIIFAFGILCGLDIRPRHEDSQSNIPKGQLNRRRIVIVVLRIIGTINMILCIGGRIMLIRRSKPKYPSATDFFRNCFSVIDMIVMAWSAVQMWTNERILKMLFIRNNYPFYDSPGILSAWLICWLSSFMLKFYSFLLLNKRMRHSLLDVLLQITQYVGVQVLNFQYVAVAIYLYGMIITRCRLSRLNQQLMQLRAFDLIAEKDLIRVMIKDLNRIFGTFIALVYTKIFLLLYISFVLEIVNPSLNSNSQRAIHMSVTFLNIACLYSIACVGGDILMESRNIARRAATQRLHFITTQEQEQICRHLAFDDLHDTITILDCIHHSKSSFISFLGALVTSIGVLLQFDYPLMAKFDKLKNSVRF